MAGFTPGPWIRSTHGFNIVTRPSDPMESTSVCEVLSRSRTREEHVANAQLIADAPLIIRALIRAVLDGREVDKWQDHAERVVAHALGLEGEYNRKALYDQMSSLRKSWGNLDPHLPTWDTPRVAHAKAEGRGLES